ncbi:MAG: ribosomal protein S18-alanine N-acetyltransferase [Syntrophobacterales bacterium]|jgi:ribosomal-protein-alanine N-acetyltransferase|nr:ribosomal protein S18-alanine N-acetyltransferase [Syntrophobacterales bacterium]
MKEEPFYIRPATENDLDAIDAMEGESFLSPWPRDIFRKEMQLSFSRSFAAAENKSADNIPVGYIFFWIIDQEMQLHRLAVKKTRQRQGIGSLLLQEMINTCRSEGITDGFLEVRASNQNAINLYQKAGFTVAGVRKGYYDDTREDALIMKCTVKQP